MAETAKETKLIGYLPNDQPPIGQMILLGFQHVLTMFPATVLVALLVGFDVGTVLTVSGVATIVALVLSRVIGGKFIPLYYGSSFSYIAATLALTGGFTRRQLRAAMAGMGAAAEWMVGDSMFDAGAARGAGLRSIIVRRDEARPSFYHDRFVDSLDRVASILFGD